MKKLIIFGFLIFLFSFNLTILESREPGTFALSPLTNTALADGEGSCNFIKREYTRWVSTYQQVYDCVDDMGYPDGSHKHCSFMVGVYVVECYSGGNQCCVPGEKETTFIAGCSSCHWDV